MITRVFQGHDLGPVVRHLYAAGARLIASWDEWPERMEPPIRANGRADTRALVQLLAMTIRGCERAPAEWVFHVALRNAPEDRELSDEEWAAVCVAAVDRTGIAPDGDLAACRWVGIRTADAGQAHIVATLAREDGREPKTWRSYYRLRDVAHEFEEQYGLRSTNPARAGR